MISHHYKYVYLSVDTKSIYSLGFFSLFFRQSEVSGRKIQKVCISASIPSGGYSYGQSINVEVTVNNRIYDTLNRFDICIIRVSTTY